VVKFKRTMPMLIAVNLGLTIITAEWVDNSVEKGEILPAKNYSVSSDPTTNITNIATRGSKILAGKQVWIMSTVRPLAREWKDVIQAAGGELLNKYPKKMDKRVIIIGKEGAAESKERAAFRNLGFKLYDSEYLTIGLLTHKFPADRTIKS